MTAAAPAPQETGPGRVFVFAGTADGRQLVSKLLAHGAAVTASVVSRYGGALLTQAEQAGQDLIVNEEPLDEAAFQWYCRDNNIGTIVDASHPYAVNVSQNAMAAAKKLGLPYIRYERDVTEFPYDKLHLVHSYEEAAEVAASLGETIFLTTGSRNLAKFKAAPALAGKRLIARILPTPDVVAMCDGLGFSPADIVAMQGPFTEALNRAMLEQYHADVLVTKNSGSVGGTDTKFAAAKALGLPVVVIDRPKLAYPAVARNFEDVVTFLKPRWLQSCEP